MLMKRIAWIGFFILIILASILFVLHWKWRKLPSITRSIYILDKTVYSSKFAEHKSFFWVLSNRRYQKQEGVPYRVNQDYYGFFPIDPALGTFDFRTIRLADIDRYADSLDLVYYVDCYGVYSERWAGSKNASIGQKVYGGLNQNDFLLLKGMKERGKMIIAEHNLFSSAGGGLIKTKLSELFGFSWKGWVGRSFPSFDTSKPNGPPKWLVDLYETEYGKSWPNAEGGIVFIDERERVVLLLNGKELFDSRVSITSTPYTVKNFGVEQEVPFFGWFEVVEAGPQFAVFSTFSLNPTLKGALLLRKNNIPESFPAAIGYNTGYLLYYFAGDFSHTPAYMITSEMVGGEMLNQWLSFILRPSGYDFFNGYYRPFLSKVLDSYSPPESPIDSLALTN